MCGEQILIPILRTTQVEQNITSGTPRNYSAEIGGRGIRQESQHPYRRHRQLGNMISTPRPSVAAESLLQGLVKSALNTPDQICVWSTVLDIDGAQPS